MQTFWIYLGKFYERYFEIYKANKKPLVSEFVTEGQTRS